MVMHEYKAMEALIIAGGKGTRLAEYTTEIPKPMIQLCGKPVLEHQIEVLKRNGITDITITVGHLKEAVMDYFKDGRDFGVKIKYLEEEKPLGTCGVFYLLNGAVKRTVFVVLGDVIFDMDISRFYKFHKKSGAQISLVVHPNTHPYDSDIIDCDDKGKVKKIFSKKGDRPQYLFNRVNAGAYLIEPEVFDGFQGPEKRDLEKDLISSHIVRGEVYAYHTTEYLKDMGTMDRLQETEKHIKTGLVSKMSLFSKQKCVFLDRDGTINKLKGLIYSPDQIELEENAGKALHQLNDNGYLCIIITNQPVIARNLCDFDTLDEIQKKLETLLGQEHAFVNDTFICPHHPDKGYPEERPEYKIKCTCRKPEIGMVQQAVEKHNIDLSRSFFVGDTTTDILTGSRAGLRTILLKTGEAGNDRKYEVEPDQVCENLLQAVNWILTQ